MLYRSILRLLVVLLLLSATAFAADTNGDAGAEKKITAHIIKTSLNVWLVPINADPATTENLNLGGVELPYVASKDKLLKVPTCDGIKNIFYYDVQGSNLKQCKRLIDHLKPKGLTICTKPSDAMLNACRKVGLFDNLETLAIPNGYLYNIKPVADLPKLRSLALIGGTKPLLNIFSPNNVLTDFSPLTTLTNLTSLRVENCERLSNLETISELKKLTSLSLSQCDDVADLAPLANLTELTELNVAGCKKIADFALLAKMTKMQELNLSGCENFKGLEPLVSLKNLEVLKLMNCKQVVSLKTLAWLPNLTEVQLAGCDKVASFYPISGLTKLKKLSVTTQGNDLRFLQNLSALQELRLEKCVELSNIAPLGRLKKLKQLMLLGCPEVTDEAVAKLQKELPDCKISKR